MHLECGLAGYVLAEAGCLADASCAAVPLQAPNINSLWASIMVEELCRLGCNTFCVAPGARNDDRTLTALHCEACWQKLVVILVPRDTQPPAKLLLCVRALLQAPGPRPSRWPLRSTRGRAWCSA
jgi:hypothetical protein